LKKFFSELTFDVTDLAGDHYAKQGERRTKTNEWLAKPTKKAAKSEQCPA